MTDFAGETMTRKQIYDRHNVGKRYIDKNYRETLIKLETEGKIHTNPPASERLKKKGEVTFAGHVKVTFPSKTE